MFERVVKFHVCMIIDHQPKLCSSTWKIIYNSITNLQNIPNNRVISSCLFFSLPYKVKVQAEAVAQRRSIKKFSSQQLY